MKKLILALFSALSAALFIAGGAQVYAAQKAASATALQAIGAMQQATTQDQAPAQVMNLGQLAATLNRMLP